MFPNRLFPARLFPDRMFPPVEGAAVPEQPEVPVGPSTGGGDLTRLLAKRGEEPFLGLLREVVAEVDLFLRHETDYTIERTEDAEAILDWDPAAEHTARVVHVAGVLFALDTFSPLHPRQAYLAEGSLGVEGDASPSASQSGEDEWLLTDDLLGLL